MRRVSDSPGEASPLVSILTPSYNQAAWLQDNLDSVSCQTYPRIEHVVMDGGSTDGSVEILRAAGDSLVWRSEPDRGQADAISKAFSASSGEIIGWINSDDAYFDCRVIADVVAFFERNPQVDVAYGHAAQTTEDGAIIQLFWVPPFDDGMLRTLDFIIQPAAFIRRRALTEPMLDESFHFGMDYELWLRLSSRGRRFARIDRITAIDRHQRDRKSSTIKDVHAENLERLATMYDVRFSAEWERRRTSFYVRQRLMGALLLPRIRRSELAFSTPPNPTAGVIGRQVWQRKSTWPEEYR